MESTKKVVEITTNVGCRISCSYCPQARLNKSYKTTGGDRTLGIDDFALYLSGIPESVDVHFSGFSEPFHNTDTTLMILHAHQKGHKVAVFTTMDGLTPGNIDTLASIPFKRFSIHAPDRAGLMRMAVDSNYIRTLKYIVEKKISGLEFFVLGMPHPDLKEIFVDIKASQRVHTRAGNVEIFSNEIFAALSRDEISHRTHGHAILCRRDRVNANVLLPNGDLYLCCMDYSLEEKIGSLRESKYMEVITGANLANVISRMASNSAQIICRRCEYALPATPPTHHSTGPKL